MSYELSIVVYGPGTDPQHRSHWGLMINRVGEEYGDLLHTQVINLERLWYQFEERSGAPVVSRQSEGRYKIAVLTEEKRRKAKDVIGKEPAPRDGKKRCQDWVLDVVIALEVEEIVDPGLSNTVGELVGKPAKDVAAAVGEAWIPAKGL
jgi:hypothetical protein